MKSVIINGQESGINGEGLPRVSDLIELIKNSIDPDHMITSLLIDGRELAEEDWGAVTSRFETSIIEVETGSPESFFHGRLTSAPDVIQNCFLNFRAARKLFQQGLSQEGNQRIVIAVNTLQAFFEWYTALLELLSEHERPQYKLEGELESITTACKKICQQQLYQSWWALAESIEQELEPALDALEDKLSLFIRRTAEQAY